MDISTFLGNKIIDHLMRNQAYTPPATIYVGAHSADPGITGTSEVGTPGANGYARQALALNAGGSKATANTSQIQITMPNNLASNTPVSWLGVWETLTGSNFFFRCPILGTALEATVTTGDVFETGEAHGYATDDRVEFFDAIGSALPAGIVAGTIYYVLASGLTTTQFKVSTTSGGGALDVTAAGGVISRKIVVQPFNASNILQIAAGALTFAT